MRASYLDADYELIARYFRQTHRILAPEGIAKIERQLYLNKDDKTTEITVLIDELRREGIDIAYNKSSVGTMFVEIRK